MLVLHLRKIKPPLFLFYFTLTFKAALRGSRGKELDDDFSTRCKGYAKMCHQLVKQNRKPIGTNTASGLTFHGNDGEKIEDEDDSEADLEDDELPLPKENQPESLTKINTAVLVTSALSRFFKLAKASKEKEESWKESEEESEEESEDESEDEPEEESEEDSNESRQDESNPKRLSNHYLSFESGLGMKDVEYAERVVNRDTVPEQEHEVPAQEPKFEGRLILPITDEANATRYSSAVCPWNAKLLRALGVKPSSCNVTSLSEDREILCKKAMGYLLELTEDCQTKYELEFEGVLVEEMNTIFISLKKLIDAALQ